MKILQCNSIRTSKPNVLFQFDRNKLVISNIIIVALSEEKEKIKGKTIYFIAESPHLFSQ